MPSIHDLLNLSFHGAVMLLEYDGDGNITYSASHTDLGALDENLKWDIKRFWYENGNLVKIKRQSGAWSDRTSLNW